MRINKLKLQEFIVHFLFGAILGAPMGFGLWAEAVSDNYFFNSFSSSFTPYPYIEEWLGELESP